MPSPAYSDRSPGQNRRTGPRAPPNQASSQPGKLASPVPDATTDASSSSENSPGWLIAVYAVSRICRTAVRAASGAVESPSWE